MQVPDFFGSVGGAEGFGGLGLGVAVDDCRQMVGLVVVAAGCLIQFFVNDCAVVGSQGGRGVGR